MREGFGRHGSEGAHVDPWASADRFARVVERYRDIGFDEIVCYSPEPHERAVFDEIAGRLHDGW